jgi:small conductance mechanosensitive channel
MDEHLKNLDQVTATAIDLGMRFGPKLVVALLMLAAGYVAGRWAQGAAGRALDRIHVEPPARQLTGRIVHIAVFALFAVMALQNIGIELLPLLAGVGIAGAGVALAMQGVLRNVVAGLTIIFTRPFRVGDFISIVNEQGEVLDVRLFSTVLGHADLSKVVIPNRKIVGEILHNYGRVRQLALEVGVSYDADVEKALRTISAVLGANARVLQEPAPAVGVVRLADSSVTIAIGPWVSLADYAAAMSEINRALLAAFREGGIAIPCPQREIRLLPAAPHALGDAGLRAGAA